jgi:Ca-activated chloride channel family protein
LTGVKVEAEVLGRGARVRVSQNFINREEKPLEAVYKFPLSEGSAVCGFKARIDGSVIEGRIEERDKAFEL